MSRIEKTVFISYRRTNVPWALAIFQDLTRYDYDVFFDFQGIASGDFEQVILENIRARAHFLVLLTPSALERCGDHGDWLRREIETALEARRNIVPLMLEGFDFTTPSIAGQLTGKLSTLKQYNALRVPADFFAEAMDRLRERFLNVQLDAVLHPASLSARQAAEAQQSAASEAPAVDQGELTAQEWFEKGLNAVALNEKIRCYSQTIGLKPDYADAYYNRGNARHGKGDLEGALADYTEALWLDPQLAKAYHNRGMVRRGKGDLEGALTDYTEALRLKPDEAKAYYNRGIAWHDRCNLDRALADYTEAIRLNPEFADAYHQRGMLWADKGGDLDRALADYTEAIRLNLDYPKYAANAYYNRGNARHNKGDLDGALADYTEALRLKPEFAAAYYNRGVARHRKGDLDGAMADYNEALRLKPNDAKVYYNRGMAHRHKGDLASTKAAIADFQKYLDLGGGNRDSEVEQFISDLTKELTAQEWFEKGLNAVDPDEKVRCYSEALSLKPEFAAAYYNRGLVRANKGDLDGALADYTEAIRLKPDYAWAYYNRGMARDDKGDLDGAMADYNEAIRLNPGLVDAYTMRGLVRVNKRDLHGAMADYNEAIRLKPDYAWAYYNRGMAHNHKGDLASTKAAIADFQKYLDLASSLGDGKRRANQAQVQQLISDLKKKL